MAAPRPLLIHGSGGDHRVWALQAARFEGAIALDLPGGDGLAALPRVEAVAEALAPAIEGAGGPRVLVGHSLGGAVALQLALIRPDLVDGLVIVASGARMPVPDRVLQSLADDFETEARRVIAASFADPTAPMAERALAAFLARGQESVGADYAACRSLDLRGRLGGVGVPALVVAAAEDRLTPPWLSEELARELPLAQMVVVPEARHMPMAEFDNTVNLLLAAYLARLELT